VNAIIIAIELWVHKNDYLSTKQEASLKKFKINIMYPKLLANYCANKKIFVTKLYYGPQYIEVNCKIFLGA
jgi:hypothetical protein